MWKYCTYIIYTCARVWVWTVYCYCYSRTRTCAAEGTWTLPTPLVDCYFYSIARVRGRVTPKSTRIPVLFVHLYTYDLRFVIWKFKTSENRTRHGQSTRFPIEDTHFSSVVGASVFRYFNALFTSTSYALRSSRLNSTRRWLVRVHTSTTRAVILCCIRYPVWWILFDIVFNAFCWTMCFSYNIILLFLMDMRTTSSFYLLIFLILSKA